MSNEKDALLSQIGELAGQINRHKNQQNRGSSTTATSYARGSGTRGRGFSPYATSRPFPEQQRRRGPWRGQHHNRSLVLNKEAVSLDTSQNVTYGRDQHGGTNSMTSATASAGWVAKKDRHLQLINSSVYDQQLKPRTDALESTRAERIRRKEDLEKAKLRRFAQACNQEVDIGGLRYRVLAGGSKLERIAGEGNGPDCSRSRFDKTKEAGQSTATPKRATVAGVNFTRSKNGNLYRVGLFHSPRLAYILSIIILSHQGPLLTNLPRVRTHIRSRSKAQIQEPCRFYSNSGTCNKGLSCPYVHDPEKVAICQSFLMSGSCEAGDACDLSHEPTPHRVPACLHFGRNSCSKPDCRYAHVRVNPSAAICRPFATYGYCSKGSTCTERHVRECPDFEEKGDCDNPRCKLQHIERAGRQRAATRPVQATGTNEENSGANNNHESDDGDNDGDDGEGNASDVDSDTLSEVDWIRSEDVQDREALLEGDWIGF